MVSEGAIRAVEGCQTDPPRIGARSFKVGYSKEKELALAHRPKEAEPEGGWVSVARPESRRRMHQQQQQQQGQQQSSSPAGPRSQHANRNSQTGGIITLLPGRDEIMIEKHILNPQYIRLLASSGTQLPIPMMPPGANNMMQQQPLQIFSQPSMQLPTLPPQNFQTMDGMNSALSAGGSSLRGRIDRQDVLLFRSRAEYLAMIGEDIFESRLSLNINQREQSMGRKLYYYHPSSQRSYHHNYDYDAQRSMSSDNFGSRQHDDFSYHDSRSNGDGGGSQRGSSRGRRRRRYEYEDGRGDSHRNENDYRSSEGDYRQSRHHEPSSEDRYSQRRRHYESSSPRSPQHHYDNRDGHDAREVEKDSPLHRSSRSQRNHSEHEDHRHPDSAYEDNSKHSKSESDIYYD